MATIYRLTIDPVALGITKPIDKVYIKNLYVDTDDTHIRTAPFEYGANITSDISFVELPPTTLGSIYQIQLFGSEGMALSVFFGMPKRNTKLSELDIFTAYPPRSYYPEASVAWGQLSGAIANQTDLVDVMFTKSSASAMQAAIDSKNSLQDTAINLRATTASVNAKNALQDTAIDTNKSAISNNKVAIESKVDNAVAAINSQIALKANTADVDSKNALQDSAITALQDKNVSQDAAIELRAITTEVGAALDLKANTSDVNSKNTLQDNAITAAQNKADAAIPKSEKGAANGVATLDADGKVTPTQLPDVTPVAWGNITGNIADQTDLGTAATKEVGVGVDQIPLVENIPDLAKTTLTYTATTTSMPNTVVDSTGTLKRSTQELGTAATKNVGTGADQLPTNTQADSKYMPKNLYGIGTTNSLSYGAYVTADINDYISSMHNIGHLRTVDLLNTGTYGYPMGVHFNLTSDMSFTLFYSRYTTSGADKSLRLSLKSRTSYRTGFVLASGINAFSDSNGFWKTSSPVVRVYANDIDPNDDAEKQGVTFTRNGVGDYTLHNTLGLAQEGWRLELPEDDNRNPLVAIETDYVDGDLNIRIYKRIFSMQTFTFGCDYENPIDIPDGRCVDVRLHEIEEEEE